MLFNRLFELGLLDLKPCPTGRFVVPKGLAGIIPNFREKSRENFRCVIRKHRVKMVAVPIFLFFSIFFQLGRFGIHFSPCFQ
jgi:hypothetical protein